MSNEEKVNAVALKMIADAYHDIGYRRGVYNATLWALCVVTVPFVYSAVKGYVNKKTKEKTED